MPSWWMIRNKHNEKCVRIPAPGGVIQEFIDERWEDVWLVNGHALSKSAEANLDDILEMFLQDDIEVQLEEM